MDNFTKWLTFTLGVEGGKFDDPRATHTDHGIRQDIYNAFAKQFNKPPLSVDVLTGAQIKEFYQIGYWIHCGCDKIPNDDLAGCVFDTGVNCGQRTAILFLQDYMGLVKDGSMGPKTQGAIITMAEANDFACIWYIRRRRAYYNSIGDETNIKGWLNRCDALAKACNIDPQKTQ